MNKISKSIILGAALTMGLTSCNDWLDVDPTTQMDRSALFSTEAGFADAMSGIYGKMTSANLYGKALTWGGLDLMGGASYAYGSNADLACFYWNPENSYYYESDRNSFVDPIWNEQYNTIANINSLLGEIDNYKDVFEGDDYSIFKGEALGLRAFLHFDLLRLFSPAYKHGGTDQAYMPYVTQLSSDVNALLTPDQICALMIDDLEKAKELLKKDPMYTDSEPTEYTASAVTGSSTYRTRYNIKSWHNRRFHFNYYAAVATEARIYLWQGNTAKALECAKEVIAAQEKAFWWVNPTLVANVASSSAYTSRDRTFSTEQIFALNILDLEDRTDGYLWEGETSFSSGNYIGFSPDVFDATTANMDPRYAYLKVSGSFYGSDFCASSKYRKDNDYGNNYSPWSANRLPLLRSSEMYYIAAECAPTVDEGLKYLEAVRTNRGMSAYPLTVTTKDELQGEIQNEYHKEFIAEGQYFYYLKRMNIDHSACGAWGGDYIPTDLYTMVRPDDENTYGGRPSQTK